jgi:hypothetical protein
MEGPAVCLSAGSLLRAVTALPFVISTGGIMGPGATQGDEKRLPFSNHSPGEPPLRPCHPDRRSHGPARPTKMM